MKVVPGVDSDVRTKGQDYHTTGTTSSIEP